MKKFKKDPAPKVTVLVAHPDDETLWAGGLLHSHPEWDLSIVSLYEKALISPDLHPEDWSHDSHQEPHYSFWFYKIYRNNRFDLLGNSLAILSGIASGARASMIIEWVEHKCKEMRKKGEIKGELPPNFFPFVLPHEEDWRKRYRFFNQPGSYHNGGIWPFIVGFYISALVAAKEFSLAESKLAALTRIIRKFRDHKSNFGFNEWIKAQDGHPMGQDWQSWSAAMYLYAAKCVETKTTPFFTEMRSRSTGLSFHNRR